MGTMTYSSNLNFGITSCIEVNGQLYDPPSLPSKKNPTVSKIGGDKKILPLLEMESRFLAHTFCGLRSVLDALSTLHGELCVYSVNDRL